MKRLILYLLAALAAGALLFGWGYRRGAASVVVRDSVTVRLKPLPPLTVTIRDPWPVAVHDPPDTVRIPAPADTAAIIADYLRTRDYHFDFSSESTGMFLVDASVGRNRLLAISPTIRPLMKEVERVREVVRDVQRFPRWELEAAAGALYARDDALVWIGGRLRHTRGRLSFTAEGGWTPRCDGFYLQGTVGVTLWRKWN